MGPELDDQPLLVIAAIRLRDRGCDFFLFWLSSVPSFLFASFPTPRPCARTATVVYFWQITALRHSILAAQCKYLGLRPVISVARESITRWGHAEPPSHLTPLPEPFLRAMACLAWHFGRRVFAGIALLACYGLGRIGEAFVLTCFCRGMIRGSRLGPPFSGLNARKYLRMGKP